MHRPAFFLAFLALPLALYAAEEAPWKVEDAHGPTHSATLDVHEGTWMSVSVHGDTLLFDLLGDLWRMPVTGGEATRLTGGTAWDVEPAWSPDGKQIAFVSDRGGNEQIWLMDADGQNLRQLTDEKDARVTDPVWDPRGDWVLARRRTIDTRSIGVTELWQYHLDGGSGLALTSKDAYPHAGEMAVTKDSIYFSSRFGRFEYNQNPVGGLWDIQRLDRHNGSILRVAGGSGSAARPVLSPDQKWMAFISRDRQKTLLELIDLGTGARKVLGDWLSHDEMEGFALHGVWPRMDWSKQDQLILWSGGKLWKVNPNDGSRAEIPFHVKGDWRFNDVVRPTLKVADEVQAKVIRWPVEAADKTLAFSAMGELWIRKADGSMEKISTTTGYSPAWSPDGSTLAWTSWSDTEGGRVQLTRWGKNRSKPKTETLPFTGQFVNPAWGSDGSLVVLRGPGGGTSPDLGAEPYYEVLRLTKDKTGWHSSFITTAANPGSGRRAPHPFWYEGRLWLTEDIYPEARAPEHSVLVSYAADGSDRREHIEFESAEEVVPSPDFRYIAYKSRHQAYLTAFPHTHTRVAAGDLPTQPLSTVVGDWLAWTPDGKQLTWMDGFNRSLFPVAKITVPADDPKPVLPGLQTDPIVLKQPRARPSSKLALTHARIVTMKGDEIRQDATLVVDGDRIVGLDVPVPADAKQIDCTGKTIIPGLIDVHAHLHYTAGDILPAQEWRYQTALDFGVTTVHDPSASTDLVFTQAERVEAGLEQGPRVYSTGYVLYGALSNQGANTPTLAEAQAAVQRQRDAGAISVKVYQQSQRERRQWYAQVCRETQTLCVSEGGGDLWQDLTMYTDGFQAVEHTMPGPPLFADVQAFVGASHTANSWGTANSATLLVSYNSISGENWFYQHLNPINNERLLRHYPRRELDARAWRLDLMAQDNDWTFQQAARDSAAMLHQGALITLGAHGQLQGLGAHWELWAMAGATGPEGAGAMSPLEALRAATLSGARYLGLDSEIGSIEAGKLADFIVLNADPLTDIHNSTNIAFTVKNGAIWE